MNLHVLYTEDDPTTRIAVEYHLKEAVQTVTVAANGAEGLELFIRHTPDIVITDINMPVMDGLTMASKILEIDPDIPIIVLSGINDSDYLFKAINLGIRHYETKPLQFEKLLQTLENASRHKAYLSHLRLSAAVFDHTQEAIIVTGHDTTILDVNRAFTTITGYSKDEVVGQKTTLLKSGRHDEQFYRDLWATLHEEGSWQGNIWNKKKNGRIYPEWLNIATVKDHNGTVQNYIAIFSDITQLKENEKRLEFLAHHDTLTALPNRVLLTTRLEHTLETCHRLGSRAAVCFVDLDNFKHINDSYGHDIGDEVLKEAAKRLQSVLRANDTLARLGGDEFVFVFEDLHSPDEMGLVSERILESLHPPFVIDDKTFMIGSSIGISIYPDDGNTASVLTKNADTAMYAAKNAGKNTYRFYTAEMTSSALYRMGIENALNQAIHSNEIILHYQPKIDLTSHKVTGLEALVRWNHPTEGLLYPDKFIAIAEETKLIVPLGELILRQACKDALKWRSEGLLQGRISVNVSGIQINKSDFLHTLRIVLLETGASADMIEIEITETAMMDDPERWIRILGEIRQMGFHISIDDFGTGYSSLSYLRRLPVDILKIDRSFVKDLSSNDDADILTATIINMAHGMGLKSVAEGVETENQKEFLLSHGCTIHQGYLYFKPLDSVRIERLLIEQAQNR